MKTLFLILVLLVVTTTVLFAQPQLPSGYITQSPIDGGLIMVALAGGSYALKELFFSCIQNMD